MNKINTKSILQIIKEIIKNACVIFAAMVFFIGMVGYNLLFTSTMNTGAVFMSFAYALLIAAAYKIFAIKILPVVSQHIIFFALIYIGFMFMYMPSVNQNITPQTTLYLTVGFVVVYFICLVVVQFIKYVIRSRNDKKQIYEDQFDKLKK